MKPDNCRGIDFPDGHRCYGCAELVQHGHIAARARLWCHPCLDVVVALSPATPRNIPADRLWSWMQTHRP